MTPSDGIRRLFRLALASRSHSAEREVDDELRFHLESRVAELVGRGHARADAEQEAAREFGDVGAARVELTAIDRRRLRRAERGEWWTGWVQDVRYAVRALGRQPGFTTAVLLTVALGVGANGAVFSAADAALLRPLPYQEPDRLVHLWQTSTAALSVKNDLSYPNFLDWRERSRSFSGLAGYHTNRMVLIGRDQPRVLWTAKTSANFFDVLGARPALGRLFAPGEDAVGAGRVVVLSHELWAREFGADARVLGSAVNLDGAPYTVVGVLPRQFQFARAGAADAWVPIDRGADMRERRRTSWFNVIGRLAPGVSLARAQREMDAVARDLAREFPDANADRGALVVPLREELTGAVRPLLLVLLGAAACVLLVGLANVASLLLVRGTARQQELGVRAALGAGQGRIVRQLLTESVLLAVAGGAIGVAVAQLGLRALVAAIPPERLRGMPYLADVGVSWRVVAGMLLVSLVAGLAFGAMPALRVRRGQLSQLLRDGGRASSGGSAAGGARDLFVAAQLAMTVVLVTGAALLGKSLTRVLAIDPGFRAERVFTVYLPLPRIEYASSAKQVDFFTRLEERVRALPGVEAAGLTSKLPLDWGNSTSFRIVGQPEPEPGRAPSASFRSVTPGYFRALGIPLVRGAVLSAPADARDSTAAREVVISETLARKAFGNEDPVGRQLATSATAPGRTIVGVVGDVAIGRLEDEVPPAMYFALADSPESAMRLAVRTRGDVAGLEASIRRVVRDIDPQVALYQAYPMESLVRQSESVFMRRFPLLLFGAFAATALALAVVGTYGVISYAVAQRARELGIRIALGARSGHVVATVVRHAVVLAAVGIGVGLVSAALLSRFAASLLFGVGAGDPASYAAAAVLLAAVAAAAAAVPAWRATRVDPVRALRNE